MMADGAVGFRFRPITVLHSSFLPSCIILDFLGAGVGADVVQVVAVGTVSVVGATSGVV